MVELELDHPNIEHRSSILASCVSAKSVFGCPNQEPDGYIEMMMTMLMVKISAHYSVSGWGGGFCVIVTGADEWFADIKAHWLAILIWQILQYVY